MKKERLLLWLARRIPRKFLYWVAIRIGAMATTGKYSDTIVSEVTFMEVLGRLQTKVR